MLLLHSSTSSNNDNDSLIPRPSLKHQATNDFFSPDPTSKIQFNPWWIILSPLEKKTIKVQYRTDEPETVREMIECLVKNGNSLIIELIAEVQNTSISLNKFKLEYDCLYAGNVYEIGALNKQCIKLQNLGNIPTKFKWSPVYKENLIATFEPCEGEIAPKKDLIIKVTLKPILGGKLEEIFICECEGLEYPLGFEINTIVYGLSVDFELTMDEEGTSLTKIEKKYEVKTTSLASEENNMTENKKKLTFADDNDKKSESLMSKSRSSSVRKSTSRKSTKRRSTKKKGGGAQDVIK